MIKGHLRVQPDLSHHIFIPGVAGMEWQELKLLGVVPASLQSALCLQPSYLIGRKFYGPAPTVV
jgi:hypothetical protein